MGTSASKESKYYPDFEKELPSLKGKTVVITGCTSGTGLVTAKCAVRKGADAVLLLNRPSSRATDAEAIVKEQVVPEEGSNTVVETIPCDLQSFDSVKQAAAAIKKKYKKVHVLACNAGVMALEDKATGDGYDVQMQTNHLSHFLLTKELFPLLAKEGGGRIAYHSSMARSGGPLKPEYFGKNGGNLGGNGDSMMMNGARWERYHQTKLANATMTLALADKLSSSGTCVAACAAPGLAETSLQTTTNQGGGMGSGMWMMRFAQSAEDGAMPFLSACFSPETKNGDFWEPANYGGMKGKATKVKYGKHSLDKEQQKMLWEESEAACGKFEI